MKLFFTKLKCFRRETSCVNMVEAKEEYVTKKTTKGGHPLPLSMSLWATLGTPFYRDSGKPHLFVGPLHRRYTSCCLHNPNRQHNQQLLDADLWVMCIYLGKPHPPLPAQAARNSLCKPKLYWLDVSRMRLGAVISLPHINYVLALVL